LAFLAGKDKIRSLRILTLQLVRGAAPSRPPTHTRSLTVLSERPQSDQAMAAKLIRALIAGRAASDVIVLQDE